MSKTVEQITLADLPAGSLFKHKGTLALKSEYLTKDGAIEAHIVGSGEMFWGGTHTAEAQRALIVEPYSLPSSPDVAGSDAVAFYKWVKEYREHRESKVKAIDSEPEKKAEFIAMTKLFKEPELLYGIFQSEHPQPAGASVEQAARLPDNTPKEIYLQVDADGVTPEDFKSLAGVTWSVDRVHDTDVKYVLAGAAFQAAQGWNQNYLPRKMIHSHLLRMKK